MEQHYMEFDAAWILCGIREREKEKEFKKKSDIHINLLAKEKKYCSIDYLNLKSNFVCNEKNGTLKQKIKPNYRAVLIDWLVNLVSFFECKQSTFYLCVELIDSSMSKLETIDKNNFQLFGVVCLFLAIKFEEVHIPLIKFLLEFCDNTNYTKTSFLNMEKEILKSLNFNVNLLTPFPFFELFLKKAGFSTVEKKIASYYLEYISLWYDFRKYKPSLRSAAALYLASSNCWNKCLQLFTEYRFEDLKNIINDFNRKYIEMSDPNSKLQAIRRKYLSN